MLSAPGGHQQFLSIWPCHNIAVYVTKASRTISAQSGESGPYIHSLIEGGLHDHICYVLSARSAQTLHLYVATFLKVLKKTEEEGFMRQSCKLFFSFLQPCPSGPHAILLSYPSLLLFSPLCSSLSKFLFTSKVQWLIFLCLHSLWSRPILLVYVAYLDIFIPAGNCFPKRNLGAIY